MLIFGSKKDRLGFDDRWMVVIGIPIVTVLVDALVFGSPAVNIANGTFWKCMPIGFLFTSVLWLSFRELFCFYLYIFPDSQLRTRQFVTVASVIIGFFIIDFIISQLLLKRFFESNKEIPPPDIYIKIITSLIFSFLIYAIYEAVYLTKNISQKMIEREQLMKENIKSQLSGLRAQINPHFLFNSLNTLSTLVHESPSRADQFVTKLSKVYRYMLDQDETHLVLLSDELNYLNAYKHLLNERFGENLIFNDQIDPKALAKYTVPMSLQIIFENCVKHNIATKEKPLTISMQTSEDGSRIAISNNLQILQSSDATNGVGLENIKKRYACFTTEEIIVTVDDAHFSVSIPLLADHKMKDVP